MSTGVSCVDSLWPQDCNPPGSSAHGIFRQEYRNRLPSPPPGDLPDLRTEPTLLASPAVAGRFFTTSVTWEAPYVKISEIIMLDIYELEQKFQGMFSFPGGCNYGNEKKMLTSTLHFQN